MPDVAKSWKTVNIGVLVEDTGEKLRTIQHWSDLGILRPERISDKKWRGTYRIYRADPLYGERTYVAYAAGLAQRLPLGDIRHLVYAHRLYQDPVELLDRSDPRLELAVEQALRFRDAGKHLRFEDALNGEPDVYEVISARPEDEASPFTISYLRQAGPLENPDRVAKENNEILLKHVRENTSGVIINLSKIFEPLRRPLKESDFTGESGRARHVVGDDMRAKLTSI